MFNDTKRLKLLATQIEWMLCVVTLIDRSKSAKTLNPDFENYLTQMYPVELEIKDTMESNNSAAYLDFLLSIGRDGQLHTSLYHMMKNDL